ncbi:MAG TPA: JAB domain-containing protein [Streptosporangiaceae bacterium]
MPVAADDRSLLHDLLGPAAAALVSTISMDDLLEADPGRLAELGLRRTARRRLLAGAELARRYQPACAPPTSVTSPRSVVHYLASLRRAATEVLGVLALDARQAALGGLVRVAEGSVSHVTAEPREVFSPALERRASAIVLAHNHPSGNPEPSLEDVEFTRAMCDAGVVLGIQVLDHLVVSRRAYVSLRERGLMIAGGSG